MNTALLIISSIGMIAAQTAGTPIDAWRWVLGIAGTLIAGAIAGVGVTLTKHSTTLGKHSERINAGERRTDSQEAWMVRIEKKIDHIAERI